MSTNSGKQQGETCRGGWVCYLAYALPVSTLKKG